MKGTFITAAKFLKNGGKLKTGHEIYIKKKSTIEYAGFLIAFYNDEIIIDPEYNYTDMDISIKRAYIKISE